MLHLLGFAGAALASDAPKPPAQADTGKPEVKVIEQIVAKVNGEIVTTFDLERSREQLEADLTHQQLPPDRLKQMLKEAEENLLRDKIDQMLLAQKAKDLNIDVAQDVSKYLAKIQVDSKITDTDKFQEYLREQTGMPFEDFKAQLRDNMATREVIRREVGGRIVVSKAEQQKYYEEHKNEFIREEQVMLREIFLSTAGKDVQAAAVEKKAKDLVSRARKGENFATLAHDNSDATTAPNYGELPPFKRGQLKKEIEDLVFKQERSSVTDPIKQENGFLILKVEEHYKAGLQPFEAVENDIMEKLTMPKMQPAVRTYLTKLRQDAFLEVRSGFVDTGAAPGKDTSWRDPARLKPQTVTKEEVATRTRRKRLFWMVPMLGTSQTVTKRLPPASPGPSTGTPNPSPAPATDGGAAAPQPAGTAGDKK
jgi:peptidyl-prolyl cis-trans isomerase SurA